MATVWPSSLLNTARISCTSTLRLPKSKQRVDYFINGNSYTKLKYGTITRRHHSLISRTPLALQSRVRTEGWSSSGRRHTSYRCSSRNEFVAEDDVEDGKTHQVVPNGGPPLPEPKPQWPILERWNVPWSGTTTVAGMISWLLSFLLTGLAVSLVAARFGIVRHQVLDLDEQAVYILIHQLVQTVAGLGSLSYLLGQYRPLPAELFSYDFSQPFDLRRGWLTYGGLGILGAGASVVLASTVVVQLSGHPPPREEADALAQLLPIIGASPASTASLIVVTGVLAPFLEETVFRGFFMTSLTKWYYCASHAFSFVRSLYIVRVPTPVAIVVSACAFAGAHLTPGEFPQLAALGIVLGLAYAQTRTLSTPIFIHALWNSGVVILLTILRLQGYDIKELL